jgi:hypothetical protein
MRWLKGQTRNVPELVACKRKRPHAPSPRVAMAISIFARREFGGRCKQMRWKSGNAGADDLQSGNRVCLKRTKRKERPSSGFKYIVSRRKTPIGSVCKRFETPIGSVCKRFETPIGSVRNASSRRLESPWPFCPNLDIHPVSRNRTRTHNLP